MYLGVGGRPLALGGAYIASEGDILSGYYNPAGLARLDQRQAVFMHSETFGSLLNHDFLAYAQPLSINDPSSAFAVSLYRLGGGGILVTTVDQTGRFRVVSEENHADYVGYFSYGRSFKPSLRLGITSKLVYRDIVDESAFGLGFDMGALYSPARWVTLGLKIQDVPSTLLSYSTGSKQRVNPMTILGTALHGNKGAFGASLFADADIGFEGRNYSAQVAAGPISFDSHLGLEVEYKDRISARIGSDIGQLTVGAGLDFEHFTVDIAMRDHSDLENSFLASLIVEF